MKLLLLGKNGQVGWELNRSLILLGELVALGRDEADLEDVNMLRDILNFHNPDIIINAAAYTKVDKAEEDEIAAFKINSDAVEVMASYARQSGAMLVYYSTDYVFDGEKSGAYIETDTTRPLNVYGRSKRAGEEAIVGSGCEYLIFRTSWVYSVRGQNFVNNILGMATNRDSLDVVADQYGAPTSAELIADVTALAVSAQNHSKLVSGVYHLTASGEATWYEVACEIVSRALENSWQLTLDPRRIKAITSVEYPVVANRPKNSRLNTGLLSSSLSIRFPDWKTQIKRVVDEAVVCRYR